MNGSVELFPITGTDKTRQSDVYAQSNADEQIKRQGYDGSIAPYRGHGFLTDVSSHNRNVGGIEYLLNHSGKSQRNRKNKDFVP